MCLWTHPEPDSTESAGSGLGFTELDQN